jgi:hypothetical protein
MQIIGVFLIALKLALLLLIVVVPVLAIVGFAFLWWRSWSIRGNALRTAVLLVSSAGMTVAIAWMVGNDAVGFLATIGTWP